MSSPITSFTENSGPIQGSTNPRKHPHVEDNDTNQVINLISPVVSATHQQTLVATQVDGSLPWAADVADLGADLTPSPDVVDAMHSIYKQHLKGFAKTFRSYRLAIEHRDRFQRELGDGETIPDEILRTLKGPVLTFPECVHEACLNDIAGLKMGHESQLNHTRKVTAQYMLKALSVAVTRLCELVEVQGIVDSFGEELKTLCKELLTLAGIQTNPERWKVYIARMARCLGRVLDQQKIKVVVAIRTECETKNKKKAAIQSAQMDVEMKDATKTVKELVSEKVKIEMKKYRQAEAQKAKATNSNGTPPSKKQKQDPKPSTSNMNARASSSKTTPTKNAPKKDKKAPEKGKPVKGRERDGNESKGKSSAKAKGKRRATANDGSDSD